ncbi:methylaspartate mutase [Streptomyces lydicus]|uniref:methylaspartate mutase n=1 Tax=Streptomyces lydicus TaxID=47763 RepID=UPI003430EC3C
MTVEFRVPSHATEDGTAGNSTGFGEFVRHRAASGELVVQPRMGFSDPARMRAGLLATRRAAATTVGTLTVDSYTRVGDLAAARDALRAGIALNGYPLATHPRETTAQVLAGIAADDFPVQVRHGSADPGHIFTALTAAGLSATEGGPVSYCLPYGRTPLEKSVDSWARCCEDFAEPRRPGVRPHLETFGGCMLGQLCPPGQLVALSVLEALFFHRHGVRSISVSYAQQSHPGQDREAVRALRVLCARLLPDADVHIVVYAYMGLFPQTADGARALLGEATRLARATGAERLIVKTEAEADRIPTVAENVAALEHAARTARRYRAEAPAGADDDSQVHAEAYALIDAVLNAAPDIGRALVQAFKRGLLDIPYCLHPDNAGRSRSYLDRDGRLRWADVGSLPLAPLVGAGRSRPVTSGELMSALSYVRRTFDGDPYGELRGRPRGKAVEDR